MPRADQETRVFDLEFFVGDVNSASEAIVARVRDRAGGYVCHANVHVTVTSWHDQAIHRALDEAWMICPDGAPVAWMMRRLGAIGAERIAGADLMARLFAVGQAEGLRHFLFGSTTHVLERLERTLLDQYTSALIAGSYAPGPLSADEPASPDTISRISRAEPDIVWCGLGAPKQELWMRQHAHLLAPAVLIGVGAAFDFCAGTKARAPAWMQRAGFEWAHRLGSEPGRLAGRYLRTNSEFVLRACSEMLAKPSVPPAKQSPPATRRPDRDRT
jgi:N-acetylglucosaminyldiphosphoundecaprenol N-acetyl-beta-D-mannosaminyltransferase